MRVPDCVKIVAFALAFGVLCACGAHRPDDVGGAGQASATEEGDDSGPGGGRLSEGDGSTDGHSPTAADPDAAVAAAGRQACRLPDVDTPAWSATPATPADLAVTLDDRSARAAQLAADGNGGAWLLSFAPLEPPASAFSTGYLEHYAASGERLANHVITSQTGELPQLALVPANPPRLVFAHRGTLDVGGTQAGPSGQNALVIARIEDAGAVVESELVLPETLSTAVIAAAPDGARTWVLLNTPGALEAGVLGREHGCTGAFQLLVAVEDSSAPFSHCVSTDTRTNAASLAPDTRGGAFAWLGTTVVHVASDGSEPFRYGFSSHVGSPRGSPMVADGDGVILAAAMAGTLTAAGVTVGGTNTARDVLLMRLGADGTPTWARSFVSRGEDRVYSLDRLADGSLLITGAFQDELVVAHDSVLLSQPARDEDGGTAELADAFALRTDGQGEPLDLVRHGEPGDDQYIAGTADHRGGAFLFTNLLRSDVSPQTATRMLARLPVQDAGLPPPLAHDREPFQRISPEGELDPSFGNRIAVEGDTVVIGSGLHVARFQQGNLQLGAQIERPSDASEDFAHSLALSAEWLVVGDPARSPGLVGRAYVYHRDDDTPDRFELATVLQPDDAGRVDRFAHAVALADETILVLSGRGVHVYEPEGAGFAARGTLEEPTGTGRYASYQGESLATDGQHVLVGHPSERGGRPNAGAVYVYERSGGQFVFRERLTSSDPLPASPIPERDCFHGVTECGELGGRSYGNAFTFDGDTLLVGSRGSADAHPTIYRYALEGGRYRETGAFEVQYAPPNGRWNEMPMVALSGGVALGSASDSIRAAYWAGGVRLYHLGETDGAPSTLQARDPRPAAELGRSLALHREALLIGNRGGVLVLPLACGAN